MNNTKIWFLLLLVISACNTGKEAPSPTKTAKAAVPVAARPAPAAFSVPTPSTPPAPTGPISVEAGTVPGSDTWVPAFTVERSAAKAPDLTTAMDTCRDKGLALCSEAQWIRVCDKDDTIAAVETWTFTVSHLGGFVVRGGGADCNARKVASHKDSDARAGLCCSRAIAQKGPNKNASFRHSVAAKLPLWEAALNSRSAESLEPLVDYEFSFNGKPIGPKAYLKQARMFFNGDPNFWVVFDTCIVSLQAGNDTWIADCRTVKNLRGKPTAVTDRLVWGGTSGAIRSIAEIEVAGRKIQRNVDNWEARDAFCRGSFPGNGDPRGSHYYCVCMGHCTDEVESSLPGE